MSSELSKKNPDKTIIALLYDFDKTLCTENMQEYSFIPRLNLSASSFWERTNNKIFDHGMEPILAYMYTMIHEAKRAEFPLTREEFVKQGKDLVFFSGVETWFERVHALADQLDITIEHYIISSGLREIIEGSKIYDNFTEVYACEFFYDYNGIPIWPKSAVNYTTKTQFLYRINKGIKELHDDTTINEYIPEEQRRIPFRNMIYIGDGLTDVPCMKLVKVNGGCSIGVFANGTEEKVRNLLESNRVDYICPANYERESILETVVFDEVKKMALVDTLAKRKASQHLSDKVY